MNERSAKGVKGCFLKIPVWKDGDVIDFNTVFRVYAEDKSFKDYKIDHYDLFCILDTGVFVDYPEKKDGMSGVLTYPTILD